MENSKKTPLFTVYEKHKGKLIDFGGWAMPVQFEGIIPEHEAVRSNAGLFDVSHMGEVEIKGKDALNFVQYLITNDASQMEKNQIIYSFMCYENGGVVDDLLVYKFEEDYFYLVINAGNIEKDYEWMLKQSTAYDVEVNNISNDVSELALQGPKAEKILQKLTETDLSQLQFFYLQRDVTIDGVNCLISRTGYTGEDGFEIYVNPSDAVQLWEKLLEVGQEDGLKPIGLGARDTLRFEAALPLYGHEINRDITPLEAGFGFAVKLKKEVDFLGKKALIEQKEAGLTRKLVGFEMKDRGIPRSDYEVYHQGEKIGFVTTGYFSPTLKRNIGLALIDAKYAELGNEVDILIRKKQVKAELISKTFYKKNYKK
ncbi:glycine cleavage system T protein [Alkaliphilus metalliredigens QYMF]|uniref:Aminomethyltransferase n=1 Tax=Alkaliphilus metalliredigens (strain QYMF) TaxID=293826 RepID=GCST_ALKMQ|nr:glycine cleavage system aminomethyltransferase GcvT [Alkaliphilus metalliredigens]A6TMY6.1 RecName: Full=Aminomethyltransferase; AltName: Full=Glycine cleavage system T protein [Alkaliphilus metalliredigens QYMF]ABR47554.1 glycine cleavage system T protein [Alkaliphilus metalliredigens QYMF]